MQYWKNTADENDGPTDIMLLTPEELNRVPAGTQLVTVSGKVETYTGEDYTDERYADAILNGYTPFGLLLVVKETDDLEITMEGHATAVAQRDRVLFEADAFASEQAEAIEEMTVEITGDILKTILEMVGTDKDGKCLGCGEVHAEA